MAKPTILSKYSGQKQRAPLPLGDFVAPAVGDAFSKFGFAHGDLVLHWPDIVGQKLAAVSSPLQLKWPRSDRRKNDAPPELASLVLQVESHAALEIQHLTPVLLQKVNNFLGWRCVGRISLRQAPLRKPEAPKRPPRPGAASLMRAQESTSGIEDPGLRAALIRLGAQVLSQK